MEEDEKMTRKDLVFSALIGADNADNILVDVIDQLENIFGEDAPIVKNLQNAKDELNDASQIVYEFTSRSITIDEREYQAFTDWLAEDEQND